jgi:transposase
VRHLGYVAYTKTVETLNQQGQHITHASCWSHYRKIFDRALYSEPAEARHAMNIIAAIYKIESRIRDNKLNSDDIINAKLKHSQSITDSFFTWVFEQRQRPELQPKMPLTKALAYALARIHSVKTYLTPAQVQIDTNHLERALRVIPMGRKNHLFCWSELGAEQLGVLHSTTVTCKLHNINP